MLLTINMGNTRTHALAYAGERPGLLNSVDTRPDTGHYLHWLQSLAIDAPKRIVLASVVPAAAFALSRAAEFLWSRSPEYILPRHDLGLRFPSELSIEQLGADLFVNAVVSHYDYGGNILNIDLGTASTFCVIKEGLYSGTSIVPGMELSIRAMISGTALLKEFALQKMETVIQDNTTACLQSGIYFGYFELVRGMIERILAEQGPLQVVLTGGIGAFLYDELAAHVDYFRPNLTLEGLRLIASLLPDGA